jgi:hypothetical protein
VLVLTISLTLPINPTHAINTSGEKVKAVLGSGQTVKIEGIDYQYVARPSVPSAPQKPISPSSPGNPPSKPVEPSGTITYHLSGKAITESWSNGQQLRQILGKPIDEFSRANLQSQYDQYLQEVEQYNANLTSYQNRVAQYEQDIARYRQDNTRYESELAEYQAKLPEYTAAVEAEVMSIQASIYPDAPSNWDRYVEGQFLLYRCK